MTHTHTDIDDIDLAQATVPRGAPPVKPGALPEGSMHWVDLERWVLRQLKDGPKTTRELKRLGGEAGWSEEQIGKVVATRWMDLPKWPGAAYYDPWTVYHPFDPDAVALGITHAIDGWLIAFLKSCNPVPSKDIQRAAAGAGFTDKQLGTAYRRCQVVAVKKGHGWYRQLTKAKLDEARHIINHGTGT